MALLLKEWQPPKQRRELFIKSKRQQNQQFQLQEAKRRKEAVHSSRPFYGMLPGNNNPSSLLEKQQQQQPSQSSTLLPSFRPTVDINAGYESRRRWVELLHRQELQRHPCHQQHVIVAPTAPHSSSHNPQLGDQRGGRGYFLSEEGGGKEEAFGEHISTSRQEEPTFVGEEGGDENDDPQLFVLPKVIIPRVPAGHKKRERSNLKELSYSWRIHHNTAGVGYHDNGAQTHRTMMAKANPLVVAEGSSPPHLHTFTPRRENKKVLLEDDVDDQTKKLMMMNNERKMTDDGENENGAPPPLPFYYSPNIPPLTQKQLDENVAADQLLQKKLARENNNKKKRNFYLGTAAEEEGEEENSFHNMLPDLPQFRVIKKARKQLRLQQQMEEEESKKRVVRRHLLVEIERERKRNQNYTTWSSVALEQRLQQEEGHNHHQNFCVAGEEKRGTYISASQHHHPVLQHPLLHAHVDGGHHSNSNILHDEGNQEDLSSGDHDNQASSRRNGNPNHNVLPHQQLEKNSEVVNAQHNHDEVDQALLQHYQSRKYVPYRTWSRDGSRPWRRHAKGRGGPPETLTQKSFFKKMVQQGAAGPRQLKLNEKEVIPPYRDLR